MLLRISSSHDPYRNVALEKYLFENYSGEEILFLWVNDPCVVIGRNQNPWLECDLEYMRREGIRLVRRYTGGGAVYHDTGNINISWISENKDHAVLHRILRDVLERQGITDVQAEKNDLLYHGRKISGFASMTEEQKHLYHGTLMVDVDLDRLIHALTPSPLKIRSHGIDSVRARVMNLKETDPQISVQTILDAFTALYPGENITGDLSAVLKESDKLRSSAWLYDETPGFSILHEYHENGVLYQCSCDVSEGIIKNIRIYSDHADPQVLKDLENLYKGTRYHSTDFDKNLKDYLNHNS